MAELYDDGRANAERHNWLMLAGDAAMRLANDTTFVAYPHATYSCGPRTYMFFSVKPSNRLAVITTLGGQTAISRGDIVASHQYGGNEGILVSHRLLADLCTPTASPFSCGPWRTQCVCSLLAIGVAWLATAGTILWILS